MSFEAHHGRNLKDLSLRWYSGIYLSSGTVRRISFEAASLEEAREIAACWTVGVEGEAVPGGNLPTRRDAPLEVLTYTVWETAAALKVSRPTVYRLIAREVLRPLPGIRHKLIPRDQVARYASGQGWQGRN